jgi:hypothetical protein
LLACLDRVLANGFFDSRALPGKSPRVNVMTHLPAEVGPILLWRWGCVERNWLPGRGLFALGRLL